MFLVACCGSQVSSPQLAVLNAISAEQAGSSTGSPLPESGADSGAEVEAK